MPLASRLLRAAGVAALPVLLIQDAGAFEPDGAFVSAADSARVRRVGGNWSQQSYRGASENFIATTDPKAALEVSFIGRGLAVVLGGHGMPFTNLGQENLGTLAISIDGRPAFTIEPQREDRDVVVARNLSLGDHRARVEHHASPAGIGVRIAGFRVLQGAEGEVAFLVHGEANRFLTDLRAVVTKDGRAVRNQLVRNWMTGQCRLAGLPGGLGYTIELRASGWEVRRLTGVAIEAGQETVLPPVYLRRTLDSSVSGVEYPHPSLPAILQAGNSFATRFAQNGSRSLNILLQRRVGPALITRKLAWAENKGRAYDGKAEGVLTVPQNTPPGLYDLAFSVTEDGSSRNRLAARSVYVVDAFPTDPVFVTFGHLDTWGQEQAESLERLADVSNLIAPDMVLVSNELNAAYAVGALSRLQVPYLVTFGNHRVSGHEEWFGRPAAIVDFGPGLSILNYSYPWHGDVSAAHALLDSRAATPCRLINAFESDAPLDLLDRFRIPYIHDAHGEGPRVTTFGKTPTQRAGKENNSSFRVVRFSGCRPVSFTYAGHATAPIPMSREEPSPLQLSYDAPNNGAAARMTARIQNGWEQSLPAARVLFVMPAGEYAVDRGRIESAIFSDDARFVVLSVRIDVPAAGVVSVTVSAK